MTVGLHRDRWHRYRWNDGRPVPGVTSILRLQDALYGSDALTTWAVNTAIDELARQQRDGEPPDRAKAIAATHRARDIGSEVHAVFEAIATGRKPHAGSAALPLVPAIAAFLADHRPEFLEVEAMVYSERLAYGGTLDFIAKMDGQRAMVDLKTGQVKPSHGLQLAAYAMADFIGKPDDPVQYPIPRVSRHYVLRVDADGYELVPMRVGAADRQHFRVLAKTYPKLKAWKEAAA
jgi:hypothetical protein